MPEHRKPRITWNSQIGFLFVAGFAVFSVLGYMSLKSGLPIDQVVKSGPSLAFVAYPQAISLLPFLREVFGVIFFGTLVIAGISSGISLIEAFSRAVTDKFDLELSSFSSTQKDAMAAAVLASSRVPGSMWNLKRIVQKGEFATDAVSAETMWKILAPLYYRKPVTSEDIQMLQERIQ